MNSPHVYDKAKYHDETIEQHGLPEEHAANHTVVFLRWLIENDLMGESFITESGGDDREISRGSRPPSTRSTNGGIAA